jgi:UDP:flavonoid glycosyltransferase YjiC (YdhE family)
VPVESPADTIGMIAAACAQLGERALVCSGGTDFSGVPHFEHVKVVGVVNYATIFPTCRAVVHHGGAGTLAACLRAGVPQLILWTLPDQPFFAAQLKRLKVGRGRRFSTTTQKSLSADLRRVLTQQYFASARQIATHITEPAKSAMAAADLVEDFARLKHVG